jgi:hypothetical protein
MLHVLERNPVAWHVNYGTLFIDKSSSTGFPAYRPAMHHIGRQALNSGLFFVVMLQARNDELD